MLAIMFRGQPNGSEADFRVFRALLDGDHFEGRARDGAGPRS
jgi:hypothetical protein